LGDDGGGGGGHRVGVQKLAGHQGQAQDDAQALGGAHFLVSDQQMHTGSMWKMASPISHKKLSTPLQNWLTSTRVLVPFSSRYMLSMQLRKPRIRPPVIMMGIRGAKISARALMIFWAP